MWQKLGNYIYKLGCSILLDVWYDNFDYYLMIVLVSCFKGIFYFKLMDILNFIQDIEVMVLFFDGVI